MIYDIIDRVHNDKPIIKSIMEIHIIIGAFREKKILYAYDFEKLSEEKWIFYIYDGNKNDKCVLLDMSKIDIHEMVEVRLIEKTPVQLF